MQGALNKSALWENGFGHEERHFLAAQQYDFSIALHNAKTQMTPSNFTCQNAMPGLGCGFPEMIVLGCLFFITSVVCGFFLWHHLRAPSRSRGKSVDFNIIFWVSMIIWMIYRGILLIVPFDYTQESLMIVQGGVNAILALIPISILVLLVCELLFTYRDPGGPSIWFFRVVFLVFLTVFLVVGVSLSIVDESGSSDPSLGLSLWHGCTDFIVVVFVAIPASKLIAAVSFPVVQPEDATCVKWSIAGVWVFCIFFGLRCIYNILHYFGVNPVENWASQAPFEDVRIFTVSFAFVFEYLTGIMTIIGVYILRQHDLKFAEDPYYARAQTDSMIIAG